MRSVHDYNVQIAKEIANLAVPKRYILRSPNLNALRREKEKASRKLQIESLEQAHHLLQVRKLSFNSPNINQLDIEQQPSPFTASNPEAGSKIFIDQTEVEYKSQPPYFITYGCHGEDPTRHKKPKEVAKKFINDIKNSILNGRRPPEFVLLLGDNFYDNGVDSPDSPAFRTIFEFLFEELSQLKIPCFIILGNHDDNLHRLNKLNLQAKGVSQGMNQVSHSYMPRGIYKSGNTLRNLYGMNTESRSIELDLQELPLWNMPNRFYSLDVANAEIFCIDSNTYVKDYFEYLACLELGIPVDPNNQAVWLARESARAKAEGKEVIFAQHHPLITPGKRADSPDSDVYLDLKDSPLSPKAKELAEKRFHGLMKNCFSDLLKAIYEDQKLSPDIIIHAHDHSMYRILYPANANEPLTISQFCFGGGGGSIQERRQFSALQEHLGCHIDHHGVGEIICDREMRILMHSTCDKYHLEFRKYAKEPIRTYVGNPQEQNATKKFCDCVRKVIEGYFKQGVGSGNVKGVKRAHDIWAYISNHHADSLLTTVTTVKERILKDYIRSPNPLSLVTLLNEELSTAYKTEFPRGVTIQQYAEHLEHPRLERAYN